MTLTQKQKTLLIDTFTEKITSKKDLEKKILQTGEDPKKTLETLRKAKKIKHLFKQQYYLRSEEEQKKKVDKYSTYELIAVVLNRLNIKWYFGLQTAEELNKTSWQATKKIHVINNKLKGTRKVNNQTVQFHKVKNIGEFIKHKTKNRVQIHIATEEQTQKDKEKLQ